MSGAAGGDDVEAALGKVLAAHIWHIGLGKCECGWEPTYKDSYAEDEEDDEEPQWAGHVALMLAPVVRAERAEGAREALEEARRERPRAPMPVCTDPECTIPRKPGFPMHGPHDFRARAAAHATQETTREDALL